MTARQKLPRFPTFSQICRKVETFSFFSKSEHAGQNDSELDIWQFQPSVFGSPAGCEVKTYKVPKSSEKFVISSEVWEVADFIQLVKAGKVEAKINDSHVFEVLNIDNDCLFWGHNGNSLSSKNFIQLSQIKVVGIDKSEYRAVLVVEPSVGKEQFVFQFSFKNKHEVKRFSTEMKNLIQVLHVPQEIIAENVLFDTPRMLPSTLL